MWAFLGGVSRVLGYIYCGRRGTRLCGRLWIAEAYSPTARLAVRLIDRAFAHIGDPDHCRRCFVEDHTRP